MVMICLLLAFVFGFAALAAILVDERRSNEKWAKACVERNVR